MGPKGKILITLILLFIALSLTGGIFLLLQLDRSREQSNQNEPEEEDPNIIDPDNPGSISKKYTYAAITNEDTIKLFDELGNELVINLEHRQWSDIKWSKDKNFISAIGKDTSELDNLHLYTIETGLWEQVTNYEDSSVEQQVWQTDNNIFYTQGISPERWIHRFRERAKSELFKLIKTDGRIEEISQNFNKVIVSPTQISETGSATENIGGEWIGYIADGREDWILSEIRSDSELLTESTLNILDVLFSTNSEKILITALNDEGTIQYYKTLWGSNLAIEIDGTQLGYTPVCAVNEDVFMGYRLDPDAMILEIINYNIKTETSISLAEFELPDESILEEESINCYDTNNLLVKVITKSQSADLNTDINTSTINEWYTLSSNRESIEKLVFLGGMLDVDAR